MHDEAAFNLKMVVADCLAGCEKSVEKLVRHYHGLVFGLCLKMLGQRQDAEDATQETFTRVVRSLAQWDSSRRFEPWLLTVAGNRCRTKISRRMSQVSTRVLEFEPPAEERQVSGELILEEVQAAVALLRPEYQQVFTLFHIEQRSFEEIASQLQVPYATVKTWCHRARREVASILQRRGNLPEVLAKS